MHNPFLEEELAVLGMDGSLLSQSQLKHHLGAVICNHI
jgi:hypothetical protein